MLSVIIHISEFIGPLHRRIICFGGICDDPGRGRRPEQQCGCDRSSKDFLQIYSYCIHFNPSRLIFLIFILLHTAH